MDLFQKIKPIYFYFISIVAFVLANLVGNKNAILYYPLLIVGLVFFLLGLMRRMKTK
jgi:hypothetical protein